MLDARPLFLPYNEFESWCSNNLARKYLAKVHSTVFLTHYVMDGGGTGRKDMGTGSVPASTCKWKDIISHHIRS